jgi:hypothetical protein
VPDRETHDRGVDARRLLQVVAALFMVVGATVAAMLAWHRFGDVHPAAPRAVAIAADAPAPETDPVAERAGYDAQKARLLNSAGWVDRQRAVVHLPIERAMQLLVERDARAGGAK